MLVRQDRTFGLFNPHKPFTTIKEIIQVAVGRIVQPTAAEINVQCWSCSFNMEKSSAASLVEETPGDEQRYWWIPANFSWSLSTCPEQQTKPFLWKICGRMIHRNYKRGASQLQDQLEEFSSFEYSWKLEDKIKLVSLNIQWWRWNMSARTRRSSSSSSLFCCWRDRRTCATSKTWSISCSKAVSRSSRSKAGKVSTTGIKKKQLNCT